MIFAEFFAVCLWPVLLLLIALRQSVRDPALLAWIGPVALSFGIVSLIFLLAFGQSSLIAVFHMYFVAVALGAGLAWRGFCDLRDFIPDLKTKLRAYALILVGGGIAFVPVWISFRISSSRASSIKDAFRTCGYRARARDAVPPMRSASLTSTATP
jgi:hypothetical protein